MQFIVTKNIAVEAETAEEAVAKVAEGKTISLNAQLRPQQATAGRTPMLPPGAVPQPSNLAPQTS
jgi:hypothetical protein